ncbi:MAG: hypothetical protein ACLPYS_03695 [Vulcanimicrobiaceae bacterium]
MRRLVVLCAVAAAALSGCSDAPHTVMGGDSLIPNPCQQGGINSGNRWQDLYACYFGPSGVASCGSQGTACHGSADALGAETAPHFLCGTTSDTCWQGMINAMAVPDGGSTQPTGTLLYSVLRKTSGDSVLSTMPLGSTYAFPEAAVAQITAWIEQGAQNN